MAKDRKSNQRLKEPTAQEVAKSVVELIQSAAEKVLADHRGDVMLAEHVQITKIYLVRALELLDDRKEARELFDLLGYAGPGPDDTIH